jgi:hypothetical protein
MLALTYMQHHYAKSIVVLRGMHALNIAINLSSLARTFEDVPGS